MPPRKSNISTTSAGEDGGTPVKERDGINIEDLSLPRTMVQRLAKGVLPPNTSLSKDTILAMQKSATVFISHLAAQANTTTQSTNRRTIPPNAIFEALQELEFEGFIPRVEAELKRFNEIQTGKRNEYRRKVKEGEMGKKEDGGGEGNTSTEVGDGGEEQGGEDGDRATKRPRMDDEGEVAMNGSATGYGARQHESPSAQLRQQMLPQEQREWDPDQDPEEDEDEDVEDEDEEGGVGVGHGEEGAEEEDDDADEYPDAGHRAESLGMDDPDEEDQKERRRRFAYGPGGEGGGDESSGGEEERMDED